MHIIIVQIFVDLQCDGKTALMFAAERGQTDIVQALINAGANVGAKNRVSCLTVANVLLTAFTFFEDGKTALMMAAQGGHTETVKALIVAGADVNVICEQVN